MHGTEGTIKPPFCFNRRRWHEDAYWEGSVSVTNDSLLNVQDKVGMTLRTTHPVIYTRALSIRGVRRLESYEWSWLMKLSSSNGSSSSRSSRSVKSACGSGGTYELSVCCIRPVVSWATQFPELDTYGRMPCKRSWENYEVSTLGIFKQQYM